MVSTYIYAYYEKKVYERNVVNKYRICLLLGVMISNLIGYMYHICYMYIETDIVHVESSL